MVSRTLPGRAPEKRIFLIRSQTKISKSLRLKSRVTVRYQSLPEGDVALQIQVRAQHYTVRPVTEETISSRPLADAHSVRCGRYRCGTATMRDWIQRIPHADPVV
jgi:hypothetical protein